MSSSYIGTIFVIWVIFTGALSSLLVHHENQKLIKEVNESQMFAPVESSSTEATDILSVDELKKRSLALHETIDNSNIYKHFFQKEQQASLQQKESSPTNTVSANTSVIATQGTQTSQNRSIISKVFTYVTDTTSDTSFTVDAGISGAGSILYATGERCRTSCSIRYPFNTRITLSAYPDEGYVFSGWSGACHGNSSSCEILVTDQEHVTATFTASQQQNPNQDQTTNPNTQGISLSQVATHNTSSNCWIIVSGKVYSVASYISLHPGGRTAITNVCGTDATVAFTTQGGGGSHSSNAWSILGTFLIGTVGATPSPVNGVCGGADGATFSSAPTSGLCSAGTQTTVSGTGPWNWSCTGSNGGSTASCTATKGIATPVNGACGSADGTPVSSTPTTKLCSSGTASSVSGTGPWNWSCVGVSGGTTASCAAPVIISSSPKTYTINVNKSGEYDITSLTVSSGDSVTIFYTTPRGDEIKTVFTPSPPSSVKVDKDITSKTVTFTVPGTYTFKAKDYHGNTGTIIVK